MWLTSSSIGRKFIMALTGAFLILFVTFHALMNGVAVFWPTAYNTICEFLGANWYALIGSLILAGGFALHILYALWLTWQNRRARGADRYAVTSRPKQVEWSSKNMLVLGIVVICFLALHMYQFWAKMQLVEALHLPSDIPPAAGTLFLQQVFSCPWMCIIYIIAFVALWLHMTHGFWSMFHTCGWDNNKWINRLKVIGNVWATIVCALFIIEAVVFTINAKKGTYLTCPALLEQYEEMALNSEEEYPMTLLFDEEWALNECAVRDCDIVDCNYEGECQEFDAVICGDCDTCDTDAVCEAEVCQQFDCVPSSEETAENVADSPVNVKEFQNN